MTALEIIALRNPALATSTDIDGRIALAEGQISATAFGNSRSIAVALKVLHDFAMDDRKGVSGAIAGESGGPTFSRQYAQAAPGTSGLESTSYGKELLDLRKACISGIGIY